MPQGMPRATLNMYYGALPQPSSNSPQNLLLTDQLYLLLPVLELVPRAPDADPEQMLPHHFKLQGSFRKGSKKVRQTFETHVVVTTGLFAKWLMRVGGQLASPQSWLLPPPQSRPGPYRRAHC